MAAAGRWTPAYLTPRGWGLFVAGAAFLLLAWFLGRRDLLYVSVFLLALPLLAGALLRVTKPSFSVVRTFAPPTVPAGSSATVRIAVRRNRAPAGSLRMTEHLPWQFGKGPEFSFPARYPSRAGVSFYEYPLRPPRRGLYGIGPVQAMFTDPFGLGTLERPLGEATPLIVTPPAAHLQPTSLTGGRGAEGSTQTKRLAVPSNDDVMTREYRHGDSLRRVHWPATARQGALMVRQEESVSTPHATLLLDRRLEGHGGRNAAQDLHVHGTAGVLTSASFDWAVEAAMTVAAHFLAAHYDLRFWDESGHPALAASSSARWKDQDEFNAESGAAELAEGLAALGLGDGHGSVPAYAPEQLGRMAAKSARAPLVAVTGYLNREESLRLAEASRFGVSCTALLVSERPAALAPAVEVLRAHGWNAVAVSPRDELPDVWDGLESMREAGR